MMSHAADKRQAPADTLGDAVPVLMNLSLDLRGRIGLWTGTLRSRVVFARAAPTSARARCVSLHRPRHACTALFVLKIGPVPPGRRGVDVSRTSTPNPEIVSIARD